MPSSSSPPPPPRETSVFAAKYAGAIVRVRVDAPHTYGAACEALARELGLVLGTVRVHERGRAQPHDYASNVAIADQDDDGGRRRMVTGARCAVRDAAEAHAEAGARVERTIRGFDDDARRARMMASTSSAMCAFTFEHFGAIEALDVGDKFAAEALLRRLGSDPGVVGVMRKHKWRVGKLCEMPPEGKVGVSEFCVLGYNTNKGQSIHLRLRTDDMRGFRDYTTIRKTLLHELAHNVYSDHGEGFKALNSQLNAECDALDWKRSKDSQTMRRAMEVYEPKFEDEPSNGAMAATKKSSGSRVGASSSAASTAEEVRAKRLALFEHKNETTPQE